MKKILTISVCHQDREVKEILSNISSVEDYSLKIQHFYLSSRLEENPLTDIFAVSENLLPSISLDGITKTPVLIIQNSAKEKIEGKNRFPMCRETTSIKSFLRAIVRSFQSVKLELPNGKVLKLTFSLPEPRVELLRGREVVDPEPLPYRGALVLKELFSKPGRVVEFKKFLRLGIKEESLPVYISTLRKKLKKIDPNLEIKSHRSKGYSVNYSSLK